MKKSIRGGLCQSLCALAVMLGAVSCSSSSPMGPTGGTLQVSSITPASASTTGGATVTITGQGFAAGATVTIGGVAATDVAVTSATTLTAIVATRATAGAADVVVTVGSSSQTLTGRFTYVAPSGANQPPVISSIRSAGPRPNQPSGFGDINETLTLVATVSDVETSPSALTYQWIGNGTFGAAGSTTTWQLPANVSPLPSQLTVTLRVTENYSEGGVTHRNVSTANFIVSVHDSQTEILDMGVDFLTLWSNSSNSTNTVLHNFSTTCDGGRGRSNEASDTDNAHAQFVQDFSKFTIARRPPVTYNFGSRCSIPSEPPRTQNNVDACSSYTVHWEINQIPGGQRVITDGIDYVSAVLENNQWHLCHSDFVGVSHSGTASVRGLFTSSLGPRGAAPRYARPRILFSGLIAGLSPRLLDFRF